MEPSLDCSWPIGIGSKSVNGYKGTGAGRSSSASYSGSSYSGSSYSDPESIEIIY